MTGQSATTLPNLVSPSWAKSVIRFASVAICAGFLAGVSGGTALADGPRVLDAQVEVQANGLYAFSVTIVHNEGGWTHYVDRWEILGPDGAVLGTRTLYHPHDANVPFTRSLANVQTPIGVRQVTIRANCNVDGYGESELVVELPPR